MPPGPRANHRRTGWRCLAGALAALLTSSPTHGGTPAAGTATLSIRADGGTIHADLSAPALTLVGFTGSPGNAAQRQDLALAVHNLKTGDAVIRFNPQAQCVLETAKVDDDPKERGGAAELGASYRFGCALPGSLDSVALGLFVGFPALRRVHVRYATARGKGAAVLTPGNPVATFVPLQ